MSAGVLVYRGACDFQLRSLGGAVGKMSVCLPGLLFCPVSVDLSAGLYAGMPVYLLVVYKVRRFEGRSGCLSFCLPPSYNSSMSVGDLLPT